MSDGADRVIAEYYRDKVAACERLVLLCMDHHEAEMLKNDELRVRIAELEARNRKLEKVLRPFAGAVYNDNGDISVSASSVSFDAWADAYFAMKDCAALSTKEDGK